MFGAEQHSESGDEHDQQEPPQIGMRFGEYETSENTRQSEIAGHIDDHRGAGAIGKCQSSCVGGPHYNI